MEYQHIEFLRSSPPLGIFEQDFMLDRKSLNIDYSLVDCSWNAVHHNLGPCRVHVVECLHNIWLHSAILCLHDLVVVRTVAC